MDTRTHDEMLAIHHSRLVDYVLTRLATSPLVAAVVGSRPGSENPTMRLTRWAGV